MASAARAAIDAAASALRAAFRALAFDRRMAAGLFAAIALLPPLSPLLGGSYLLLVGERVLIFSIAAISLELLIGAGGLVSFGHAAFLGVGAYAAGIAASHGFGTLAFALPAALAASALFALLTGAIAMRTRGVYFIMITLAFGQMAFFVATSLAPYGGDDGLSWPGRTQAFGTRILESRVVFFYAALGLAAGSYVLVSRIVASRFGRVLRGLTDSETRMQAIGFAPYRFRLAAYVIAGTLCGLAGFLLGNQAEFVSPAYMHWQRSGELIVMVLLGGTGTLYGPLLGALALLVLEEVLSQLTEHWKAILGLVLVLVVLFARGGIAGAIEAWRQRRMTPAQLLAELDGRARAAIVRSGRFAQEAIDSARRLAREADARVGARWLRWQAVLRPRLNAGAAKIEGAAALLTARLQHSATVSERLLGSLVGFTRRIAAALDHARTRWQAVMQRRLDALAVLSRRGIAQLLVHAEPCRQVLHRTLKSATGSAARGISVARDRLVRWRRR